MRGRLLGVSAAFLATLAWGCVDSQCSLSYRTVSPQSFRDRNAAGQANERGLALVSDGKFDMAEAAFREALRADLSFAAAHNNLGLIQMLRGKIYEAAVEFSFAGKLDPRAVEPALNLGRLYERIGWLDAAITEYEKALTLDGTNPEAMGRLARVYSRVGQEHDKTEGLIRTLAVHNRDSEWTMWAMGELEKRRRPGSR